MAPGDAPKPRSTLRVLFIDDSSDDIEHAIAALKEGGFDAQWERVETLESLRDALARGPWDVVLADHRLPNLDVASAFRVLHEVGTDPPFLLIRGAVPGGEGGATGGPDGRRTLLRDNLQRLAGVVEREMRAAEERRRRRAAETAPPKVESRTRALIADAGLGICRIDPTGKFVSANAALVAMLGHARSEDLLARDPRDLFGDAADFEELHVAAWRSGGFRRAECRWRRADGCELHVLLSARRVDFVLGYDVFVEDVTEQKRLEAELHQVQRLESLGQLAGGVAHDFNNLLTVIGGYVEMMLGEVPPDHPRRRTLSQIGAATERASDLVRQLLAFSRHQPLQLCVLDLNAVVTDMDGMLRCALGTATALELHLDLKAGHVRADRSQIEQVLLNLAVNARDAMPGGGRVVISTRRFDLHEADASAGLPAGSYVRLSVSDTGTGIAPEIRDRIFDPFFTTKDAGKGTGLGLSTVYGIVRQCGGAIRVESEPGRGATFHLDLPTAVAEPAEGVAARPLTPPARAGATVLVVEDDEALREVVTSLLRAFGHEAIGAPSAAAALEELERGLQVDLLLTDVVMPGLTGAQLAARVRHLIPGGRVLFMSGYAEDTFHGPNALPAGAALLRKPFSAESLAQKVREVLGEVGEIAAGAGTGRLAG